MLQIKKFHPNEVVLGLNRFSCASTTPSGLWCPWSTVLHPLTITANPGIFSPANKKSRSQKKTS